MSTTEHTTQVLFVSLASGLTARVAVEIYEETTTNRPERPRKHRPNSRELHQTAEALLRRVRLFHALDD